MNKKAQEREILQTERLILREMRGTDIPVLCGMLQDPEVMYAWEHTFSDQEVQEWLQKQLSRYAADGFGLWAVVLKATGEMIGQCGLTRQEMDGASVIEVGYLFLRRFQHHGYASEAARACKEYAFSLGVQQVYSIIRTNNTPSIAVALRNGMRPVSRIIKHYSGIDMPHTVYAAENH